MTQKINAENLLNVVVADQLKETAEHCEHPNQTPGAADRNARVERPGCDRNAGGPVPDQNGCARSVEQVTFGSWFSSKQLVGAVAE